MEENNENVEIIELTNSEVGEKVFLDALKKMYPENYIEIFNEMMEDIRTKSLIYDEHEYPGIRHRKEKLSLGFSEEDIPVLGLMPTQIEIDTRESIDYVLKDPECMDNFFINEKSCCVKFPLVVLNGTWIIDGHHRWAQMCAFNPNAVAKCYNFTNLSFCPRLLMMKIQKAALDRVTASANDSNSNSKLIIKGENLLSSQWEIQDVIDYVENVAGGKDIITDKLKTYVGNKIEDWIDALDYIVTNLIMLKEDNQPLSNMPKRNLIL